MVCLCVFESRKTVLFVLGVVQSNLIRKKKSFFLVFQFYSFLQKKCWFNEKKEHWNTTTINLPIYRSIITSFVGSLQYHHHHHYPNRPSAHFPILLLSILVVQPTLLSKPNAFIYIAWKINNFLLLCFCFIVFLSSKFFALQVFFFFGNSHFIVKIIHLKRT